MSFRCCSARQQPWPSPQKQVRLLTKAGSSLLSPDECARGSLRGDEVLLLFVVPQSGLNIIQPIEVGTLFCTFPKYIAPQQPQRLGAAVFFGQLKGKQNIAGTVSRTPRADFAHVKSRLFNIGCAGVVYPVCRSALCGPLGCLSLTSSTPVPLSKRLAL